MTYAEKKRVIAVFESAIENASEKLQKYIQSDNHQAGQPGILFLKQVRIFNPSNVPVLSKDVADYPDIPGMSEVPSEEFKKYTDILAPAAIQSANSGPQNQAVDIKTFWPAMVEQLPTLSTLARKYIYAVINSADVERSFSIYNFIVTSRRRSLSLASIRALTFLYYNLRLKSGAIERDENVEILQNMQAVLPELPDLPYLPDHDYDHDVNVNEGEIMADGVGDQELAEDGLGGSAEQCVVC